MKKNMILKNPDRSKWYIATAAMCLFFFPVFAVLIVFAIKEFKNKIKKNEAILYSSFGALLFSLTYFALLPSLDSANNDWLIYMIFVIPQGITGIFLLCVYFAHARFTLRLSRCLSLIQRDHITRLDELGEILGITEKQTGKCVQRLIKGGYIRNASINEAAKEITFAGSTWAKQRIICKYCGGESVVNLGHTLVCDFCGQAITADPNSESIRRQNKQLQNIW